jgi:hypothetical protein
MCSSTSYRSTHGQLQSATFDQVPGFRFHTFPDLHRRNEVHRPTHLPAFRSDSHRSARKATPMLGASRASASARDIVGAPPLSRSDFLSSVHAALFCGTQRRRRRPPDTERRLGSLRLAGQVHLLLRHFTRFQLSFIHSEVAARCGNARGHLRGLGVFALDDDRAELRE